MSMELKINDRIAITIATEGGGQDQTATIWGDDREVAQLTRHRSSRHGNWQGWFELKWTGRPEQPPARVQGGLLEYVSMVSDILESAVDINKVIRRAYLDGCKDRKSNPAAYDENADNYFICLAYQEGVRDREMHPRSNNNVPKVLSESARWGARYREEETSFLAR